METAPSEPRIRVGPQHQVIPQQDIYVRIDMRNDKIGETGMQIN